MTVRDLVSNVDVVQSLAPAARNATATGNSVDLRGYDSAMIMVSFGTWTDGTHTPSVQHSVDNVTFATVAASDLSGTLSAVSGGAGSNSVQRVGYIGERRYVRVVMTVSGATTGVVDAASVVRGRSASAPLA